MKPSQLEVPTPLTQFTITYKRTMQHSKHKMHKTVTDGETHAGQNTPRHIPKCISVRCLPKSHHRRRPTSWSRGLNEPKWPLHSYLRVNKLCNKEPQKGKRKRKRNPAKKKTNRKIMNINKEVLQMRCSHFT